MLSQKTVLKDSGKGVLEEDIHSIESAIKLYEVCSNKNRCGILYLLKECPENSMQAESIAGKMGISHRTTLYHLDILEEFGLVEVKQFRKRGNRLLRSIWGLNNKAKELSAVFSEMQNVIKEDNLKEMISRGSCKKRSKK